MKAGIKILLILISIHGTAAGQFIDEIIEYRPAPGQFINTSAGNPDHAASITGKEQGLISLGATGGYIVFRFDEVIIDHKDHPYGVDFTLFGNVLPDWSEPGSVYVMKDENRNGKADDSWYLLAGSDNYFSTTNLEHTIVYYQPANESDEISWKNSLGENGFIEHNEFHAQGYYPSNGFDPDFYKDSCRFSCIIIEGNLEKTEKGVKSYARGFGYVDNTGMGDPLLDIPDNPYTPQKEGYGGDGFDLHWAVDSEGNYVDLDTVHFVKVQSSMYGSTDILGEVSTELRGGRLSSRNPGIEGQEEMVLIEDPGELSPGSHQLNAYYFKRGRYYPTELISWKSDDKDAVISPEGIITIQNSKELSITATARNGQVMSSPLKLRIKNIVGNQDLIRNRKVEINVFPNPASEFLRIESDKEVILSIVDMQGNKIRNGLTIREATLDISDLSPGIYILISESEELIKKARFIKN